MQPSQLSSNAHQCLLTDTPHTSKVSVLVDALYCGWRSATSADTACSPDMALTTAYGRSSQKPKWLTNLPPALPLAKSAACRAQVRQPC